MKIAIIGSRNLVINDLENYLPTNITEIVSGGARGIDTCAAKYAKQNKLYLTVFLPDYERYGKAAPLKRNEEIASYADEAIAFWDGKSRGTLYTIKQFRKRNKKVRIMVPIK